MLYKTSAIVMVITFHVGMLFLSACSAAHYQYTIDVDNADRIYHNDYTVETGPPATVTVALLRGGDAKTQIVTGPEGVAVFHLSESLPLLAEVAGGIRVKVEKPGYRTWRAEYGWNEFVHLSEYVGQRMDIVSMEPASSTQPSALITSAPESGAFNRPHRKSGLPNKNP